MQKALALYQTSIGKKIVMAVSGTILFGYLLGHMAGNLLIFVGRDAINAYAAKLHETLWLLWGTRVVLLVSFVAHVSAAFQVWSRSQDARSTPYQHGRRDQATNVAARSMLLGGVALLFFVFFHISHLTLGFSGGHYEHSATDVYANVVASFQVPWIALVYIATMVALALHLWHGTWSFLQSLGVSHRRINPMRKRFSMLITTLIVVGFSSVPLAILFGFVTDTPDVATDTALGAPTEGE